jgi:hypothetical protein
MKRCPYCGKEYSDEYSVCAIDESPLESCGSKPSRPHGTVAASNAITQHTKAAWMSGACVIASIAFFFFWGLASGISGGFGVLAILACFSAVKVIMFVSAIAFIVQGFRVHWGWGLANIFLGPLAGIVFFFNHRHEGRVPVYVLVHGLILLLVIVVFLIIYKAVA